MKSNLTPQSSARASGAASTPSGGASNDLLAELAAQAGLWRVEFPRTRVALELSASPSPAERRWAGAQAELEQLHVEEFARLLAQAAALREQPERRGPADPQALAWRLALADECAAAAADGARLSPALALLVGAGRAALEHWPAARQWALAAASLWPGARTRAALGRAALADGDLRSARNCFESALAFPSSARVRGEVRAALDALAALDAVPSCAGGAATCDARSHSESSGGESCSRAVADTAAHGGGHVAAHVAAPLELERPASRHCDPRASRS
jgi:hypothetical protein